MTLFDFQYENKFIPSHLSHENGSKSYILFKRITEKLQKLSEIDSKLEGIIFKIRLGTCTPSHKPGKLDRYYFKPSVSHENFNTLFQTHITNPTLTHTTVDTISYTCGNDKVYREGEDVYIFASNSLGKYDVKTDAEKYDFRVEISFGSIRKANLDLKLIEDTAFMRKKTKTVFIEPMNPGIKVNFLGVENRHRTGSVEVTHEVELEVLFGAEVKETREERHIGLYHKVVKGFTKLQQLLDVSK